MYVKFQDSETHIKELFREFSQISEPDGRWCGHEQTQQQFKEALHEAIYKINLLPTVPKEVYVNIETAKNCMMYSFFCYRLSAPAISFALSTLEMAIALKAEEQGVELHEGYGFRKKLKLALQKKWINLKDVEVPFREEYSERYHVEEVFLPWIVGLRNGLSHNPIHLHTPWNIVGDIRVISLLINQLFQEQVFKDM